MVLAAGMVGGLTGCTSSLRPGPSVVAATSHNNHLGEVEQPIAVAMVQVEAGVQWQNLPGAVTEITGALFADDYPDDALEEVQKTGAWDSEDDEVVFLEGDLMTVYDPDAFGVGEHTVDCHVNITLHTGDDTFDETAHFAVTFEILESEDDEEEDDEEGEEDHEEEEEENEENDDDHDPTDEDDHDGADDDQAVSMQVETFHVGASDSGEPRPSIDGAGGDVMGKVVAPGGTPELVAFGLRYVEFTYEGLDPDEIDSVAWYGEVVGTDAVMNYDSAAGTAGMPDWPDEGAGSYGMGDDQIYDTDPAQIDDEAWLAEFTVDEPGTTARFPVDFEITVTLYTSGDPETASDTFSLTQYLDVYYPEPETETEIDISGFVEHSARYLLG